MQQKHCRKFEHSIIFVNETENNNSQQPNNNKLVNTNGIYWNKILKN